ncbi:MULTISPECIES: SPFH domain-containing protein [unclassified Rhizobium]|uniref:SPFH domain-containing protein n=1 Tax=unclassified Rhizobium TaxID=2613769 RepID=UPI001AD9BF7C|nr:MULTISPECIES: SPFH domain-containing protein [unclassified Rhizobium]MBO9101602.1 protease modulator HflC [Rhizobium sp. L58/93]MBO9187595.1 protease modulator HflC [Rhizobium sp. E27B/91]QXZ86622.1 protease modulator HflC [Rhizobium sp. K1/93]QXZ93345.1 protease modulator HflC [Rhizobium sp. K15/93]
MTHVHQHEDHDHNHHHDHHEHGSEAMPFRWYRVVLAVGLALIVVAAACVVQVRSGAATIITRFGNPTRVLIEPGLALRYPLPFETTIDVDLRAKSTSSGLQDVGTRDGLRVIAEVYAIWQVPPDAEDVKRFVRSVENQPDQAAAQIRTFLGSSLETVAANYDLSALINPDPSKLQISALESRLKDQIAQSLLDTYGVRVVEVGIERLTLPSVTLDATVDRMRAERETIATERAAVGKRQAAEIRSAAERDARVMQADASVKAAGIEARSRVEAAEIYGAAYKTAPELYEMLRSLDTLATIVNANTRLILRTDAAPFRALIDGPPVSAPRAPTPPSPEPGKQ